MLGHAFVRGLTNTTLVLWAGWGLWLLIGGKFFGGYSGAYWRSDGRHIGGISVAARGIAKQIPKLHGVEFRTGNVFTTGIKFIYIHIYIYVYISEYQAPDDFITIWEKPIQNCISLNKKATERLFIYKGQS